jgi:hypothetical protein
VLCFVLLVCHAISLLIGVIVDPSQNPTLRKTVKPSDNDFVRNLDIWRRFRRLFGLSSKSTISGQQSETSDFLALSASRRISGKSSSDPVKVTRHWRPPET